MADSNTLLFHERGTCTMSLCHARYYVLNLSADGWFLRAVASGSGVKQVCVLHSPRLSPTP